MFKMNKKRTYTKRFTQDETMAIIRARIKMNHLFSEKRFNLRKAWEAVGREAKVDVQHHWLYKKWANLLAIYKKCIEFQNGDGAVTSDGEISAASWVYFEEMDRWATISSKTDTTELPLDAQEGPQENEKIITIEDEDVDKSFPAKSNLVYSSVIPSDMPISTSDDAVSHLLQVWGLSDLKAKFKANYIVLQAFEYLTEEDIVELIPKIGQRAIFRGRLQEWRKQNGIAIKIPIPSEPPRLSPQPQAVTQQSPPPTEPQFKMIKLEPVDDYMESHIKPKLLDKTPSSPKLRVLLPKPQAHQNGSPRPQPMPKLVHKLYGTLTKCTPKPNIPKPSSMQSKVKQFYISPAAEPISPPSVASTPPPEEDPSSDVIRADFGPFVTSIIRVETNCDKTYQKNLSSINPPTKVNRTTILQKLTSPSSTQVAPQDYAPQKYKPPQQFKPKTHTSTQAKQETQTKYPEEIQPEPCPLYPIVKLEAGTIDMDWNESAEPLPEPAPQPVMKIKPEPETEPEPEPVNNDSAENVIADSTGFQAEFIESLESNSTQLPATDSDSDSKSLSKLRRIAPEVFRKTRKRQAKVMGKLDIRRILMNSEQGLHVLVYYETQEILDVSRRRKLIDAITQHCWLTNKRISPTDCNGIADEIIEIFPNEKKEDYYIQEAGKTPKSPLYTKYRNMGRNFFIKNNLPIPVRRATKKRLSILESENENIEVDDSFIIS